MSMQQVHQRKNFELLWKKAQSEPWSQKSLKELAAISSRFVEDPICGAQELQSWLQKKGFKVDRYVKSAETFFRVVVGK
jgi:hypothetical protein